MVCLDTTFLIDVIKGRQQVQNIEDKIISKGERITIAAPSLTELFRGLYLKKNLKHVTQEEIENINEIISSFKILDLKKESAILTGKIEVDLTNKGDVIDIEDMMIASICIKNNETLITRNKKHFEKIQELKIQTY